MNQSKLTKNRSKRSIQSTTIAAYSGVFLLIMSIVAIGYQPTQQVGSLSHVAEPADSANVADMAEQLSVDELVATNIAAGIAERADLPVATSIANQSASLAIQNQLAQNDADTISKPQIIAPSDSQRGLRYYTAKSGDTAGSVADKFNISANTVKWANNLTADAISEGEKLLILPIDGVVYKVESGDSIKDVAQTYKADTDRVVAYNDLEISGLSAGQDIILPDGVMPEEQRPGYVAPVQPTQQQPSSNYQVVGPRIAQHSAGNGYAFGNCTFYAFDRRAELGKPIGGSWGNAATWALYAQASGYTVNNTPSVGAIAQWNAYSNPYISAYGHVAVVDSVNSDGSITISEMNYNWQFNVVSTRTIDPSSVSNFIH